MTTLITAAKETIFAAVFGTNNTSDMPKFLYVLLSQLASDTCESLKYYKSYSCHISRKESFLGPRKWLNRISIFGNLGCE